MFLKVDHVGAERPGDHTILNAKLPSISLFLGTTKSPRQTSHCWAPACILHLR